MFKSEISTALTSTCFRMYEGRNQNLQQLVIKIIVQGKDMFAELPTGFDKSLMFQVGCYVDVYPA